MRVKLLRIFRAIRNFLLNTINKEFLVFLFFLVLSSGFWLLMTLNETFEHDFMVEVKLANIPRDVVITNEPDDTIRFTIRDKGYMIAAYLYGHKLHPITIDFKSYNDGKGHGVVAASDLQKRIGQQLYNSSKVTSFKTDQIEFYYNYGLHKRVPVKMLGTVTPAHNYYLSHVQFKPDSVMVYASQKLLDSITVAYTTYQHIRDFRQGTVKKVSLKKIKGAKFVPATVAMQLYSDILTEEVASVPIEAVNMPEDKVLRVFPSKVNVRFVVGASRLKTLPKDPITKDLLPKGFKVVVNYKELESKQADKCRVYVSSTPTGVRNARPEIELMDYVIEQR